MSADEVAYDYINKRIFAIVDGVKYSIPVTLTGTWKAAISAAEVKSITQGNLSTEACVLALKRHRSRNRKSLTVSVTP